MTKLAFVDTETTGLDPRRHHIWDVAVIQAEHQDGKLVVEDEWSAFVELPDGALADASATALRMTHFHERTRDARRVSRWHVAATVSAATAERHLVGAVPSFDERRLDDLIRGEGLAPAWHYHLIDVEALAAGALAGIRMMDDDPDGGSTGPRPTGAPPWRSDDLTAALGVTVQEDLRHTALGDARWAMRIYAAVYELEVVS